MGLPNDITERQFVVRRVFRLNNALPEDKATQSYWRWERGGWLLVDRISTHMTQINLPEFDLYSSVASWERDTSPTVEFQTMEPNSTKSSHSRPP